MSVDILYLGVPFPCLLILSYLHFCSFILTSLAFSEFLTFHYNPFIAILDFSIILVLVIGITICTLEFIAY